jgi:hypothetical protein
MKCIVCFTEDEFQKKLKRRCFGIDRFENKITKYRDLYIDELKHLQSVSKCSCIYRNTLPLYVEWTDDFLRNIQNNIQVVENTFDELREIYLSYISQSNKIALDKFWTFLTNNNLLNRFEGASSYIRLLFRARPKDYSYDSKDIKELFHIPFNKRQLIGNKRFSITGQPMLYLSNSILSVEKELGIVVDNLAFAGFIPRYSYYDKQKVYEIKNMIFDLLYKSLPGIVQAGCQISYFQDHITPNYKSIIVDIKKSILAHILTFPTENKDAFVSEYVLPQMITTALLEHYYKGIIFPSTKDFNDLTCNKINNEHEMNIAFFVNYNKSQNIDTGLLDSYFYYTMNGSEKLNLTIQAIKKRFNSIVTKNKESNRNNNDFIIPLIHMKKQIDSLTKSKLNCQDYYDSKCGKIELEFYMKMAVELDKYIH